MKKLINFRPIFLTCVSLCIGVFFAYLIIINDVSPFYLLCDLPILLLFVIISVKLKVELWRGVFLFIAIVLAFMVGYFSFNIRVTAFTQTTFSENSSYSICGTIKNKSYYYSTYTIIVKNVTLSDSNQVLKVSEDVTLSFTDADSYYGLNIGDKVEFTAKLTQNGIKDYGKLNTYAVLNGLKYSAKLASVNEIVFIDHVYDLSDETRLAIYDRLFSSMETAEAGISFAMLTGNSDYIEDSILDNFRYGGIAHIFAVSGLHIGLIFGLLTFIMNKLKLNKGVSFGLIFLILLFYVSICAFSPSSVRAFVMCMVMYFAKICGLKYDKLNSISLAVIAVILINPVYLFAVGFQLSVIITLSIILLMPLFNKLLKRLPKNLNDSLSLVLSAQIGAFPVMLQSFGYVSGLSLILNLIAIPLISAVFVVLFVMTFFAVVFPFLSGGLLFVPFYLIKFIKVALSAIDFKVFIVYGFSFGGLILLYYLIMFMISDKFNLNKKPKMISCGILTLIFIILTITTNTVFYNQTRLTVTAYKDSYAVLIETNESKYLAINGTPSESLMRSFLTKNGAVKFDGLIVITTHGRASPAIAKFLDYDFKDIYVSSEHQQNIVYRTKNIHYIDEKTELIGLSLTFLDYNCCQIDVNGKTVIINMYGDSLKLGDIPYCDLYLAKNYGENTFSCIDEATQGYFTYEKEKNNVVANGDLIFNIENDIIKQNK